VIIRDNEEVVLSFPFLSNQYFKIKTIKMIVMLALTKMGVYLQFKSRGPSGWVELVWRCAEGC